MSATTTTAPMKTNSKLANIRVYNTLTREKEAFQTVQPGRVGMYLCGPTVYKEAPHRTHGRSGNL